MARQLGSAFFESRIILTLFLLLSLFYFTEDSPLPHLYLITKLKQGKVR